MMQSSLCLCLEEALMEINRHISVAAAKEAPDSTLADTPTRKTVTVDQIECHIKHFRYGLKQNFQKQLLL